MTVLAMVDAHEAFSLSSLPTNHIPSPALVIAKSLDDIPLGDVVDSSIHFRSGIPSVQYHIRGRQLILSILGSVSTRESTVLDFGSRILNVGLHDDSSNLIVHVFLDTHKLYSMIITPDNLNDPRLKRPEGWITEYSAPSFQIRTPLYMHSISATSIIFSLSDGGLLRLSNNGRGYNEHLFSDSSYFTSFKSILPWSGRPSNLVICMKACTERHLLFTMSVDGKLKIWDTRKGILLAMKDIHVEPLSFLLEPIPSNFLSLHSRSAGLHLVTYCPGKPGAFKVFKSHGTGVDEVCCVREELPSTGLWLVFGVTIRQVSDNHIVLHVLWKLDNLSLLQTGTLSLSGGPASWSFALDSSTGRGPPESDFKLIEEYIFSPTRFSVATLNAALGVGTSLDRQNLRSHAASVINESVIMRYDHETGAELIEQHMDEIRLKYLKFAQVCIELDRAAAEAHTIVTSPYMAETIISQSAKLTIVRPANHLERYLQIAKTPRNDNERILLLKAVAIFQEALSIDSWYTISRVFRDEALASRTLSADDAMFVTYEKTVENQVSQATIAAIKDLGLAPAALLNALRQLLPDFQARLKGYADGTLGVDGYVACHRSSIKTAKYTSEALLAFLIFSACSSEEVNIFRASALYLEYLENYRSLLLISDTLDMVCRESMPQMSDDSIDLSGVTVFKGIACTVEGQVSTREFLERTLIFLINRGESELCSHFTTFVGCSSPLACYLHGRALLLQESFVEAASTFARIGFPLVSSPKTNVENALKVKLNATTLVDYHLHVADLFAHREQHLESTRFCTEAELASFRSGPEEKQIVRQKLFSAAINAQNWDEAYRSLRSPDKSIQLDNIRTFLTGISQSNANLIRTYPFTGILDQVDLTMERKAYNMLDVRAHPSWHDILYQFRIQHHDHRGAAAIIYHRLQCLRNKTRLNGFDVNDHLDVTESYLVIINALRCLPPDDAWLIVGSLAPEPTQKRVKTSQDPKVARAVLQLKDVKQEYDKELKNMDAQLQQLAGLIH